MACSEQVIIEGKTKIIYQDVDPRMVRIRSKPALSKGDGNQRDPLEGKDELANEITCCMFEYLNECGVLTHFVERIDEVTFRALKLRMLPLEVVTRRIATGSYLKRNPKTPEGFVFTPLVTEIYKKDDAAHDPIITLNLANKTYKAYKAGQPLSKKTCLGEFPLSDLGLEAGDIGDIMTMQERIFTLLEKAWQKEGVTLVDLKLEYGFSGNHTVCLGDVIDPDSGRFWQDGKKERMLDKQVYRELKELDEVSGRTILTNYALLAQKAERIARSAIN